METFTTAESLIILQIIICILALFGLKLVDTLGQTDNSDDDEIGRS